MIKGMLGDQDSMSNLTSASNEATSITSSNNRNENYIGNLLYPQQSLHASPANIQTQPPTTTIANKKKRNLPGNPDPEAEVIAMSPRSLLATNRFVCEICNKGFQRDQNLQLHRRGHNLPWKLKQRSNKEVIKKKVYVCPEPSCVHHHPSRALGDLTGIKKHFSRKHGEKKWKCEKCSKRYAVQSDWKAHSKVCGTREYRCDCGTLFSRRDSFITHRAFCDALAQESSRTIMPPMNPLMSSSSTSHHLNLHTLQNFQLKQEPQQQQINNFNPASNNDLSSQLFIQSPTTTNNNNSSSNNIFGSSVHMSATALLQKAAQIGVTASNSIASHHMTFFSPTSTTTTSTTTGLAVTRDQENRFENSHGLLASSYEDPNNIIINKGVNSNNFNFNVTSGFMQQVHDDMHNNMSFDPDGFGTNIPKELGEQGMTRDFLGLRGFPHDQMNSLNTTTAAGLHHQQIGSSSSIPSSYHDHQNQSPWKI